VSARTGMNSISTPTNPGSDRRPERRLVLNSSRTCCVRWTYDKAPEARLNDTSPQRPACPFRVPRFADGVYVGHFSSPSSP
jgi:hypothetical protein